MIRFGIIRFGSVNDTEASVFGYSVSTCFDRPLVQKHDKMSTSHANISYFGGYYYSIFKKILEGFSCFFFFGKRNEDRNMYR